MFVWLIWNTTRFLPHVGRSHFSSSSWILLPSTSRQTISPFPTAISRDCTILYSRGWLSLDKLFLRRQFVKSSLQTVVHLTILRALRIQSHVFFLSNLYTLGLICKAPKSGKAYNAKRHIEYHWKHNSSLFIQVMFSLQLFIIGC